MFESVDYLYMVSKILYSLTVSDNVLLSSFNLRNSVSLSSIVVEPDKSFDIPSVDVEFSNKSDSCTSGKSNVEFSIKRLSSV